MWRLDRQTDTRKPAISDISESTHAKVTDFYRLLLVVTLGIPVMPRVNTDLKLYYKLYVFVNSTNPNKQTFVSGDIKLCCLIIIKTGNNIYLFITKYTLLIGYT